MDLYIIFSFMNTTEELIKEILEKFNLLLNIDKEKAKTLSERLLWKFKETDFEYKNFYINSKEDDELIGKIKEHIKNFFESLKEKYWNNVFYPLDEVWILKIEKNNIIPVYFSTINPKRFAEINNNITKLEEQWLSNTKPLLDFYNLLEDNEALFAWENLDEFDILLKKWEYAICFNNYDYSINDLQNDYTIKWIDIVKEVKKFSKKLD